MSQFPQFTIKYNILGHTVHYNVPYRKLHSTYDMNMFTKIFQNIFETPMLLKCYSQAENASDTKVQKMYENINPKHVKKNQ